MTLHASGNFEVRLSPQSADGEAADPAMARLTLDKQFYGDLDGSGSGQMLSVSTEVEGSAAYSAIERVSGTLAGRSGTFALQHTGIMTRGTPQLSITIVPDSGTGELLGIAGHMRLDIVDDKHLYRLEYTLPEAL